MNIQRGAIMSKCKRDLIVKLTLILSIVALNAGRSWAQAATGGAGASKSSSDTGSSSALGFSIESEMLSYRALESNSQAVACDVAAYLSGGAARIDITHREEVCTITGEGPTKEGLVVLPFITTQLDDFRLWRAEMQIMAELRSRSEAFCPSQPIVVEKGAAAAAAPANPFVNLTGAGSALSLLQTGLALISSETSTSPVSGTIQDQAFMDGVARELRILRVRVIMPGTYSPDSLKPIEATRSSFLSGLKKLYEVRMCLEDSDTKATPQAQRLIADIDSYLASLSGSASATKSTATTPPKTSGGSAVAPGPDASVAPQPVSPSHLAAMLSADSLAQKLGVDPETGLLAANGPLQHILLLKALESGGTIEKRANILGTRVRYSGGSVGTYALFNIDGELECSGNVYEFGGSLPAKDFQKNMRKYAPDPNRQFIFQEGGCRPPSPR
jgi:hypothetical protein